jgi:hypothetical protein
MTCLPRPADRTALLGVSRLATPGAEETPDRYEIEIAGGANVLRIEKATDESAAQIRSHVATRREKG